jgi:undecaprenyl phosphate N,N'-diacetylbacillosamine 1-phosphate transferase
MYKSIIKPLSDFVLSLTALLILSPLFLIIAGCLFFFNQGAGVFFTQNRPGKNNKIFKLVKFKTMTDKKDKDGTLLPDKDRLTRFGRFLRSSSLDDIPQLLNVMKGDMSLIGPRPLLVKYIPLYNAEQARRHEIRPGITGWAQVNGRNAISWEDKFKLDVWYVDHIKLSLDLKILWLTVVNVLKRKGINAKNQATTEMFKGNETN